MQIEKVTVCKPIETLVTALNKIGFEIIEQRVSDYHFHEVYIKMQGKFSNKIDMLKIEGITKIDNNNFSCSCHWSTVEIIDI